MSFLGFAQHYREFFKGYADRIYPTQQLMGNKEKKCQWNEKNSLAWSFSHVVRWGLSFLRIFLASRLLLVHHVLPSRPAVFGALNRLVVLHDGSPSRSDSLNAVVELKTTSAAISHSTSSYLYNPLADKNAPFGFR